MRIINADKLKEHFKEYTTHSGIQVSLDRYALKVIEEEPTVDAVQVVRCKDCRYYYPAEYDKKGNTCLLLREMINAPIWVKEDDYCSKGVSADNGKERTV